MSEKQVFDHLAYYTEGNNLIIERKFSATREAVFKAYSTSALLEAWWGPEGWKTKNASFDFKQNGVWHYCMRCTDENQGDFFGQESWGIAVYKEIVVPEKIVYTDAFSDKEGNVTSDMPEMLISAFFKEDGQQTLLEITSGFASEEALKQVLEMGVVQGMESQFRRLDDLLAKGL